MKSIAVYCGSSAGHDPSFYQMAFTTGAAIAQAGMTVVYGGAKVGLMGAVADGALSLNGKVIGVLPGFMRVKEIAHESLTELHIVTSMHERKLMMHELSDGVITLPGGFGTMEELFEMLTWAQLGLHQKPIGVLNHNGYYSTLFQLADTMTKEGLLRASFRDLLIEASNPVDLLQKMETSTPPKPYIFIKENET